MIIGADAADAAPIDVRDDAHQDLPARAASWLTRLGAAQWYRPRAVDHTLGE